MRESLIEGYLRDQVKKIGGKAYKWVSPGTVGVPDRICVFPGNHIFFVEVKNEKGELSPVQTLVHNELREKHCQLAVVYSKRDVDMLIDFLRLLL